MKYERFLNPTVLSTPISGIRQVNFWKSKVPQNLQIKLNIGQPDLPTPEYIKRAVKDAVQQNVTKYTNLMGGEELRQAISEYQTKTFNLKYNIDEICCTAGGQSAIFAVLQSILSPGDNVIIPLPSYPPYLNAIKYNRAKMIPLQTNIESNFDISIDELRKITSEQKIKAILLISPSNPTGKILPITTLEEIAILAEEKDFLIISDEIYNSIIYDQIKFSSIATIKAAWNRTIVIQSFSKMLSMCGFRIGYVLAPKPMIDQFKVVHHTMNICANSMAQYAAFKALEDQNLLNKSINKIVEVFQDRRDLCTKILLENQDIILHKPEGAFYLYPKVKDIDTHEFCKWLKKHHGVLTVPGAFFSDETMYSGKNYLRICFTSSVRELEEGCRRIIEGLERYQLIAQ